MIDTTIAAHLLLAMLEGTDFANATRRNGVRCRIRLPDDPGARAALVSAHVHGAPMTLTFHAENHQPWQERVQAVVLAALSPDMDERYRWIALDLDASDHGPRGLADPMHAVRCIAERTDTWGLSSGLVVARSKSAHGRHVWLIPPAPTSIDDAVLAVAALTASAYQVAQRDAHEYEAPHAFRDATGAIAEPGRSGAVELIPRSTCRTRFGWALTLPCAGAFAGHDGGALVDPFTDTPVALNAVPGCTSEAWERFMTDSRQRLARVHPLPMARGSLENTNQRRFSDTFDGALARSHPLTQEFIQGGAPPGQRNTAAFAAACNLLGLGASLREVERRILDGARACELPEQEAHAVIRSALRAMEGAS